jgi:citrate synthase
MSTNGVQSGLEGVVAFATEIAEPDRDGGALRYRGIDIEDLVGRVPYAQVWRLLVDGRLHPGLPPAEPHPLPSAPATRASTCSRRLPCSRRSGAFGRSSTSPTTRRTTTSHAPRSWRSRSWRSRRAASAARRSPSARSTRAGAPRSASSGSRRYEVASALEQAALAELKARKPDRVLATNVEFWSAVVLDLAEIPSEPFTSMFTCARVAGWSAHILEQKHQARLIRPTALYVGEGPRSLAQLAG